MKAKIVKGAHNPQFWGTQVTLIQCDWARPAPYQVASRFVHPSGQSSSIWPTKWWNNQGATLLATSVLHTLLIWFGIVLLNRITV